MSGLRKPRYGRRFDDIEAERTYDHPWEVTLDAGLVGLFRASMLEASPVYSSRPFAQSLGFRDRPVPPIVLLNLGLGMSAHDLFEQAVAHLAYIDVRFPDAAYEGDTIRARTYVESVKPGSSPEHGGLSTRTEVQTVSGDVVCTFRRKVLIRAGSLSGRPEGANSTNPPIGEDTTGDLPEALRQGVTPPTRWPTFENYFDDYDIGDVVVHSVGRTIGDTEHMLLTGAAYNTHPLHIDETLCKEKSSAKTRVVDGGLVLGWTLGLTNRDFGGNALWEMRLDQGAHPSDVLAGDTLYATSKVIGKEDAGPHAGVITLRTVGTKNRTGEDLFLSGLFTPELTKTDGKLPDKVVEITRELLVLKRPKTTK